MKSPKVNPKIYDQLIFDKGAKNNPMRNQSFQKLMLE